MTAMLKAAGLNTLKNRLSSIPEGSLLLAQNVNINRDGIIEPRRGFNLYGTSLPLSSDRVKQLFTYKQRVLRHFNSVLQYDSDGSGTFLSFSGSYNETESGLRMKSIEANSNFYFTTNTGIKKISATSSADFTTSANFITDAGGVKALDIIGSFVYDPSGFLPPSSSVAYRIVWGINDVNKNLILGAPSSRLVLINIDIVNYANVNLEFSIPPQITTDYFYQVYRTAVSSSTSDPGDEMNLVIETQITAADITAGTITTLDIVPESFRQGGTPLYTNPVSGEGILQANDIPPIAKDIALYKGSIFYANTSTLHRLNIDLLSTSGFTSGSSKIIIGNSTTLRKYTSLGSKRITTIQTVSGATLSDGDYFIMGSAFDERIYTFYYDRTDVGGVPAIPSNSENVGTIPVLVNILSTDTANQVASKTNSAINFYSSDFSSTVLTNTITVTTTKNGNTTNPYDSTIVASQTGFIFTTTLTGAGEIFDTVDGGSFVLSDLLSPAQAVDEMARSLVRVINRDSNGIVFASYVSGSNDIPGLILLENRSITDIPFYLATNDSAVSQKFNPELPVDAAPTTPFTSTLSSDNEKNANRIYFSKFQQPEAVPLINFFDVGPRDKAIKRIVALRDSLFVLKEDGIYRITGPQAPNFSVTLFDDSTKIIAPDSAANLNNQIYLLSTQGVATVSETGVGVISRPIEDLITKVTTSDYINYSKVSFGIGYETDRAYILWLPKNPTDTVANQAFRYNTFTSCWTQWIRTDTSAVINFSNDKLYLGSGNTNYIEQERKNFSRADYADRQFNQNILTNGISGDSVSLGSVSNIAIGDVLSQIQYLTFSSFNQLLNKLDLDPSVSDNNYFSSVGANPGTLLSSNIMSLAIKLDSDPGVSQTDFASSISGLTDFVSLQNDNNIIVNKLNLDSDVFFTNYLLSSGTITFDAKVETVDVAHNIVTLQFNNPFMSGSVIIYKGIATLVQWAPQFFQDPSTYKQVREGTIIFENNAFLNASIGYSTDLNPGFEDIAFNEAGQGVWGAFTWSEQNWGGEGNAIPLRTLVPLEKQRCRYINVRFQHTNALESFSILGISLVPRIVSERAYR